jgi:cobalt-zinc-cadmium efflux system protein
VILWGALRVIRESVHILLEGVPRGMSTTEVHTAMSEVEGVEDIHHMNIWTICSHILALSAHVDVKPEFKQGQADVLRRIEELLFERFHISHTTLQVECTRCVEGPVIKEIHHRPRSSSLHSHAGHARGHGHSHGDSCGHDH